MDYKIIDYDDQYKEQVIKAIDQGYKDLGYTQVELDSLDQDLNDIQNYYARPSIFKLIFIKEELIACYALKITNQEAELKRVYVKKKFRGQGIAKKLSLEAFDYAKTLGLKAVQIWSGTLCKEAHNLYQQLGAKASKQQRVLGGQDNVIEKHFVKEL
jgi:GNAT superfamily N-acetyltransferase